MLAEALVARCFGRPMRRIATAALLAVVAVPGAFAKDAPPASDDPVLEARMLRIAEELRCLVCQNQTIADSHADLAVDLRRELREMLQRGDSDEQVVKYMTDRYGDFVLYRPPLKASTAVLWLGPAVLLAIALLALVLVIRKRARLADDQFEPEPMLDDGLEPVDAPARPGTPA